MAKVRLSAGQKNILFVLYMLEMKEIHPVGLMKLLTLINQGRDNEIHPNNFRTSVHTLCKNQYLNKYRDPSLKLAVTLTDQGRDHASEMYVGRITSGTLKELTSHWRGELALLRRKTRSVDIEAGYRNELALADRYLKTFPEFEQLSGPGLPLHIFNQSNEMLNDHR